MVLDINIIFTSLGTVHLRACISGLPKLLGNARDAVDDSNLHIFTNRNKDDYAMWIQESPDTRGTNGNSRIKGMQQELVLRMKLRIALIEWQRYLRWRAVAR